jgi:hypothetical protein
MKGSSNNRFRQASALPERSPQRAERAGSFIDTATGVDGVEFVVRRAASPHTLDAKQGTTLRL